MLPSVVSREDRRRHRAGQLRVGFDATRGAGGGGPRAQAGGLQLSVFLETIRRGSGWGPGARVRPPAVSVGSVQSVHSSVRKSFNLKCVRQSENILNPSLPLFLQPGESDKPIEIVTLDDSWVTRPQCSNSNFHWAVTKVLLQDRLKTT